MRLRVADGAGSTLIVMPMNEGVRQHARALVARGVSPVIHASPESVPEDLRHLTHGARAAAKSREAADAHAAFVDALVGGPEAQFIQVRSGACGAVGPGAPGRSNVNGARNGYAAPPARELGGEEHALGAAAAEAGATEARSYTGDALYGTDPHVHLCTMGHLRHGRPERPPS